MCDTVKEKDSVKRVEDSIGMDLIVYCDSVAVFCDLDCNWYLAIIDKSYYPKQLYDGSEKSVKEVFFKYSLTGEVDLDMLEI